MRINEPPITRTCRQGQGRINQQRGEPLHPPINAVMAEMVGDPEQGMLIVDKTGFVSRRARNRWE
jgi:hypothetical protein